MATCMPQYPPEGVKPIPDTDQNVFDQIKTMRDNGSGFLVPDHRRNQYRDDQLMTVYKYDSYNNVRETKNPDHRGFTTEADNLPSYGETVYLYDDLGRLRFSKTPEQGSNSRVSYTRYDEQGRVEELGQLYWATGFSLLEQHVNNQDFPQAASYTLEERVITHYDEVSGASPGTQENLRQRIVKMEYYEGETALSHATHYSYDIRGNIKTLWQEERNVIDPNGFVKEINYEFGIIDGLVRKMHYQKDEADALYP